jgi:hypothetical protein
MVNKKNAMIGISTTISILDSSANGQEIKYSLYPQKDECNNDGPDHKGNCCKQLNPKQIAITSYDTKSTN